MNQFPHDDPELRDFLQQHRQSVPPASPELEDQILRAIAETENFTATRKSVKLSSVTRSHFWLLSGGIAASLIAGLVSYRLLLPPQPTTTEMASLEDFYETNWQSTVNGSASTGNASADTDFLTMADAVNN